MLCLASASNQYPRTLPDPFPSSNRQLHRLVERETSATGLCTSRPLGNEPQLGQDPTRCPPTMVPSHDSAPRSMPPSLFQDDFVKHSSVVDLLCNHKAAIESWSPDHKPQCCCAHWSAFRSAALNPSSDHWVLSGSSLTPLLPPSVAVLAEGSLQNKVFPQKREFLSLLQRGILQWCRQKRPPIHAQIDNPDVGLRVVVIPPVPSHQSHHSLLHSTTGATLPWCGVPL